MRKRIKVTYSLYDSKVTVGIPVVYEIEESGNREVYKCAVELTESEIPRWLDLVRFDIPKVTMNNVTVTQFSEIKGIKSVDTILFMIAVEQAITVNEMVH